MEMNWLLIQILLFGCAWNLLLESKGVTNSKSCLDVETIEFDVLLILNNIFQKKNFGQRIDPVSPQPRSYLSALVRQRPPSSPRLHRLLPRWPPSRLGYRNRPAVARIGQLFVGIDPSLRGRWNPIHQVGRGGGPELVAGERRLCRRGGCRGTHSRLQEHATAAGVDGRGGVGTREATGPNG
jgi:hypothetical protein